MLTFFDYLRRRAYEAIVGGVYDALANLDEQSLPDELQQPSSSPPAALAPPRKQDPTSAGLNALPAEGANQSQPGAQSENSKSLPPPRRRGRPPKKRTP